MKVNLAVCASLAAAAASAAQLVQNVSVSESGDVLLISYSLSEDAIVVADVQTNVADDVYASVGGEHQWTLEGDVNKSVSAGSRSFTWTPSSDLPDCDIDAAKVKVVLTSYPAGDAPDYMVVSLSTASVDRVSYYPGVAWLPGGLLSNGDYLTSKIVLKHIRAKGESFRMGSLGETGRNANEYAHTVTLTNDFWIGVFEASFAQMRRFGAGTDSVLPVKNHNYNNIRGSTDMYDWPIKPAPSSYIGRLRTDTGVPFDLPSEAQWEFACRAGYGEGMLGDGSSIASLVDGTTVYNVKYMACYGKAWSDSGSVRGGSFKPNAWGLYDMYGNEYEFCVDWYQTDISANAFGEVVTLGTGKVVRGGCFTTGAAACRSALRGQYGPGASQHEAGFRLYSPYGFQDEALVDAE